MAGASRVLGTSCRPIHSHHHDHHPAAASSSIGFSSKQLVPMTRRVVAMASSTLKEAVVSVNDQMIMSTRKKPLLDVLQISDQVARTATRLCFFLLFHYTAATRRSYWHLQAAEMIIENGVVGCRSFLLIAVAGSLAGSVLCFLEGCFLVLESYFHTILHSSDQGGILRLLIESIDMFLVGTSLLTFGMGLYVVFAGSKDDTKPMSESSHFGHFNLKRLSNCMEMQSIAHAKSKLGHAVLLMLQAGVVDKFKNVPLTSSLDLVCFAGAVMITSASVFLLSKLAVHPDKRTRISRTETF